jgi:hypothetical protein
MLLEEELREAFLGTAGSAAGGQRVVYSVCKCWVLWVHVAVSRMLVLFLVWLPYESNSSVEDADCSWCCSMCCCLLAHKSTHLALVLCCLHTGCSQGQDVLMC